MKRNFLATLLFAQGVPMLLGGDEIGRTQGGNNNAYCQDNDVSYFNWDLGETGVELCRFVGDLIGIWKESPILRRRAFFTGQPVDGEQAKDVTWIRPNGEEMHEEDWANADNHTIGMLLLGKAADELDVRGRSASGDTLLLLLNAGTRSRSYTLPRLEDPGIWEELLNTARTGAWTRIVRNEAVVLNAHSSLLLRHSERVSE
jgi:isoamylase